MRDRRAGESILPGIIFETKEILTLSLRSAYYYYLVVKVTLSRKRFPQLTIIVYPLFIV